jgi:hypothetical protein
MAALENSFLAGKTAKKHRQLRSCKSWPHGRRRQAGEKYFSFV